MSNRKYSITNKFGDGFRGSNKFTVSLNSKYVTKFKADRNLQFYLKVDFSLENLKNQINCIESTIKYY